MKKNEENIDPEIIEEEFGPEAENKVKKLKDELKECRKNSAEFLAGWQRAKADLINSRKDEEKAGEDIVKYANSMLLYEMLNVLDSFEKALAEPGPEDGWKDGLRHIRNQLLQIMRGCGVRELEVEDEIFNPAEHESVAEEEVLDKDKDQIVLRVVQKGYKIHDKILRPAKVKIGKFQVKK
ncbi:MAG: nucleotide exchange factor GrpE [Candidatus Niyogibacteria bacterium]|nr:MAG: nucleotide exchange factor GrpE [Candidatus Niyogibacteria bacterium]